MQSTVEAPNVSKGRLWSSRILITLVPLFLIFDGVTKVIKERHVIAAAAQMGFPVSTIPLIGAVLLLCTAIYLIPRTAVLGAVLLTGYLGGAVASQLRVSSPTFETLFPVIFGVLIWAALFLRDARLSAFFFLRA
jgi:uncharacterized membrane protein (UPF0182 family)